METQLSGQRQACAEQTKDTKITHLLQTAAEFKTRRKKTVIVLQCGVVPCSDSYKRRLNPGERVLLEREPNNPVDRWATRVYTLDGQYLGYLPASKNQSVARLMDAGKIIIAEGADINDPSYRTALSMFFGQEDRDMALSLFMEIYEKESSEYE